MTIQSHPRIDSFDNLRLLDKPASSLGYRMPAEWEPQSCVWVVNPHNEETWPLCFEQARRQFDDWIDAMSSVVPVSMVDRLGIPTNDSWIRDFGPIFVINDRCDDPVDRLACHDFHFNGWGNKYELRDLDDQVPQHIAEWLNIPLWLHDFVLEGGSIEVNGQGTLMTTEQCLLAQNRNPGLTREQIEQILADSFGVNHLIWLRGGIAGDDTDGHIDDIARFISTDTVIAASAPESHPDHKISQLNISILRKSTDQQGRKLTVIELPVPDPIEYHYPPDRFGSGGRSLLPASYTNFLISNHAVFLPVFGQPADDQAVRLIEQAMSDYRIIPLRMEHLLVGLGGFHCLSQQQPM